MPTITHDVIIIGSGAAGLTAAINLAQDRKVLVLAKGALDGGSTNWAQGGIAAELDAGDSFEAHVHDTMVAGAGLNNLDTVQFVVSDAPAAIDRLAVLGVPFNGGGTAAYAGFAGTTEITLRCASNGAPIRWCVRAGTKVVDLAISVAVCLMSALNLTGRRVGVTGTHGLRNVEPPLKTDDPVGTIGLSELIHQAQV